MPRFGRCRERSSLDTHNKDKHTAAEDAARDAMQKQKQYQRHGQARIQAQMHMEIATLRSMSRALITPAS